MMSRDFMMLSNYGQSSANPERERECVCFPNLANLTFWVYTFLYKQLELLLVLIIAYVLRSKDTRDRILNL